MENRESEFNRLIDAVTYGAIDYSFKNGNDLPTVTFDSLISILSEEQLTEITDKIKDVVVDILTDARDYNELLDDKDL